MGVNKGSQKGDPVFFYMDPMPVQSTLDSYAKVVAEDTGAEYKGNYSFHADGYAACKLIVANTKKTPN